MASAKLASATMSAKMLCCGGNKEGGAGRDMKSAQNTPSRQPMNMPYPGQQQQPGGHHLGGMPPKGLSPPPLTAAARMQQQANSAGIGVGGPHMNNFDPRDDFKKVGKLQTSCKLSIAKKLSHC